MGKRKESIDRIRRERARFSLPEPKREYFQTNKEYQIARTEYNIQEHNFFSLDDGSEVDPDPCIVKRFRIIMSELSDEECEGWLIYIDEEGDSICIKTAVEIKRGNTPMIAEAWIGNEIMGFSEYTDTPRGFIDAANNQQVFSLTRLKEWMGAMTEKYNIPKQKKNKPLGN